MERIALAHEAELAIGRLIVRPAAREIVRDDGRREVLEHRVMQVLVALAKAHGSIVTRDELIQSCWDGRVVGDDAITRVMSRLRRAAEGIGTGSFTIQTVTKIGYRLADVVDVSQPSQPDTHVSHRPRARTSRTSRRTVLASTIAAGVFGLVGAAFVQRRTSRQRIPQEVRNLMIQAEITREQASLDAANETLAIYQRVLAITPNYADAWGKMGFSYAIYSHFREREVAATMRARAEAAGRRALELDPHNVYGELALAVALPFIGHWLEKEERLRRALARQPDNDEVLFALGYLMLLVGRAREATDYYERIRRKPFTPVTYADYILALWSSGQYEETDRAMADAAALYPTHPMVWGNRFDVLLFSGRPSAARAMVQDARGRPQNLSEQEAAMLSALAAALDSRIPAEVERALNAHMRAAHEILGAAEGAIMLASALGRVDQAFEVANAYYFSRGFTVADDKPQNQRTTFMLFVPVTSAMRADPRFNPLVEEIGLEGYWRHSRTQPDYRRRRSHTEAG